MQLPIPYIFNIGTYSDPYTSIGATLETSSAILFYLSECSEKLEPKYFIVL